VFFAPVRSDKGTIFELIQAINKEFRDEEKYSFEPQPSLSFGLTISYYKYPLFEARSLSYDQLFDRAKKFKRADGKKKDAIAFRLLKHSGSYFEGIVGREDLEYISGFNSTHEAIPEALLSSVMYKLKSLEGVIASMVNSNKLSMHRLDNLFKNYSMSQFISNLRNNWIRLKSIMYRLLSKQCFVDDLAINRQENLYSILRVIDFLTAKNQSYESIPG
jgi:CRISPR-associated protein Cmr2